MYASGRPSSAQNAGATGASGPSGAALTCFLFSCAPPRVRVRRASDANLNARIRQVAAHRPGAVRSLVGIEQVAADLL